MPAPEATDRGAASRKLIRRCSHAALATSLDGHPYVSLVASACDMDASPLLLLSDLARHTQNIAADPRVSLLFTDGEDRPDPLSGPRLSLVGRAAPIADDAARERFVARHPSAAAYAGFADFHLYRVIAERGHFVAGFGRIAWIDGASLRFAGNSGPLAEAEASILAHMNDDHAAAVALYATRLLRLPGDDWRLSGIDPEGIDLRCGGVAARLDFAAPVLSSSAARAALAALVDAARAAPPSR